MDPGAVEEGRAALNLLEGQLKDVQRFDDALSVGSRPSLNSERRMLDQVPRDTRLHYRQGSPLGLTLEELDDRGLLDGGGSVPNYYTSSRQRNRRPLEMKKRSSRLQDRGKEVRRTCTPKYFINNKPTLTSPLRLSPCTHMYTVLFKTSQCSVPHDSHTGEARIANRVVLSQSRHHWTWSD